MTEVMTLKKLLHHHDRKAAQRYAKAAHLRVADVQAILVTMIYTTGRRGISSRARHAGRKAR